MIFLFIVAKLHRRWWWWWRRRLSGIGKHRNRRLLELLFGSMTSSMRSRVRGDGGEPRVVECGKVKWMGTRTERKLLCMSLYNFYIFIENFLMAKLELAESSNAFSGNFPIFLCFIFCVCRSFWALSRTRTT